MRYLIVKTNRSYCDGYNDFDAASIISKHRKLSVALSKVRTGQQIWDTKTNQVVS